MRTLIYLSWISVLFTSTMFAETIKPGSLQANSDGVNVTLHWITEDESTVTRYEIERRTGTDDAFMTIAVVDAKGPSLYEYVDNSVFRKVVTLYQYRIKIIFSNGALPTYSSSLTVSHTVSGVRRTWGSIKAMFR